MYQEQLIRSKRKVRRKGMQPEGILLGHKVKNFMTVIFADGALSVLYNGMQICGRRIRPAHRAGFFLLFYSDSDLTGAKLYHGHILT